MPNNPIFLKVHHNQITNGAGEVITLYGAGLGGWMNMENFITGFSANEEAFRQVVYRTLGKEKADYLFDRYMEYFFTEADASFIRALGLNLVRLPFNYRNFEEDINLSAKRSVHLTGRLSLRPPHLYTILDLHAVSGYQTRITLRQPSTCAFGNISIWDRVVWLWSRLSDDIGITLVAGYDLLNEPSDPPSALVPSTGGLKGSPASIRITTWKGTASQDFSDIGPPFPNIAYTVHHYPADLSTADHTRHFNKHISIEPCCARHDGCLPVYAGNQTPIWVGEFGPVYTGSPVEDAMRYQLLEDQLSIYQELGASWSIWTYKDLGLQGILSLHPDSKWVQKVRPVLDKKTILGADSWGGADKSIRHLMEPIESTFSEFFPDFKPYPFDANWQINRMVRHILLQNRFRDFISSHGLSFDEIDEDGQLQVSNYCPRERRARSRKNKCRDIGWA
jgi:hypothetical protein